MTCKYNEVIHWSHFLSRRRWIEKGLRCGHALRLHNTICSQGLLSRNRLLFLIRCCGLFWFVTFVTCWPSDFFFYVVFLQWFNSAAWIFISPESSFHSRLSWIPNSDVMNMFSQMDEYNHLFKVVLVGNTTVGKTSLVQKFTQSIFSIDQQGTIGVDFWLKTLEVDNDLVKLHIWDTAGQERFRSITRSYYRNAHAVVFVYDLTSSRSFQSIPEWIADVESLSNEESLKVLRINWTKFLSVKFQCESVEAFRLWMDLNVSWKLPHLTQRTSIFFLSTSLDG